MVTIFNFCWDFLDRHIAAIGFSAVAIALLIVYIQDERPNQQATTIMFQNEAHVDKGTHQVTYRKAWVKAIPTKNRPGWYDAVEWSTDKFMGCREVDESYHYKTYYPLGLVPGTNGEKALILQFKHD